ncbi:MAG: hypothetical protein Ct9H300mP7_6510 [Verrucomicrobiota bacterium]|nr:MAG: hypothetical protein Ct9H300mP7_6510 [Verrucomicrobiota bacterium]
MNCLTNSSREMQRINVDGIWGGLPRGVAHMKQRQYGRIVTWPVPWPGCDSKPHSVCNEKGGVVQLTGLGAGVGRQGGHGERNLSRPFPLTPMNIPIADTEEGKSLSLAQQRSNAGVT